jgi:hypothetical protein
MLVKKMKYTFIIILFVIITRITSFTIIACPNNNEDCDTILIEYLKDIDTLDKVNTEIQNLHTKLNYLESQNKYINEVIEYNIKHKTEIQVEKSFNTNKKNTDYDFSLLQYETKLLINKMEISQLFYNSKLNSLYYRKEQINNLNKNISVFYENENAFF